MSPFVLDDRLQISSSKLKALKNKIGTVLVIYRKEQSWPLIKWEKKEKEAKSRALRKKFKFKAAMTRGFNSTDRSKANEMGGRDSQTVLDTSIVAGDVHNTRNLNMSYDGS